MEVSQDPARKGATCHARESCPEKEQTRDTSTAIRWKPTSEEKRDTWMKIAIRRISPEACPGDYRESYAGDRGANPQLSIGRVLCVGQDMRAAIDREIDNLAYLFRLPR